MAESGDQQVTVGSSNPIQPFSEDQLASLRELISSSVSSALANVRTAATAARTGPREAEPSRKDPHESPEPPRRASSDDDDQFEAEGKTDDDESSDFERELQAESSSGGETPQNTQLDAFTRAWHRQNRGRRIPERFLIPARFAPLYPVGFKPETVEHFQTFGSGKASVGREEEASSLYNTAAYTTVINNGLFEAIDDLLEVTLREDISDDLKGQVGQAVDKVSDIQIAVYGTYELAASRYELLCGRQGAIGIADPELLATYIDPPAAYSAAGRQAFRHQQKQAVKSAAQLAGRRSVQKAAAGRAGRTARAAEPGATIGSRNRAAGASASGKKPGRGGTARGGGPKNRSEK